MSRRLFRAANPGVGVRPGGAVWLPAAEMGGRGKYDRDQTAAARRREQRAALLAAAAAVFAAQGYAAASVEAIISRAKLSRRTFYAHFRGLRDVFLRLHASAAKFAVAHVGGVMEAADDPVDSVDRGIPSVPRAQRHERRPRAGALP